MTTVEEAATAAGYTVKTGAKLAHLIPADHHADMVQMLAIGDFPVLLNHLEAQFGVRGADAALVRMLLSAPTKPSADREATADEAIRSLIGDPR